MKLFVIGTRGIPNIMGGVEKHCEVLYPLIVRLGVDVYLACRSCYFKNVEKSEGQYLGINIENIYAPRKKSFEAIVHSFLGVVVAKIRGCNIIHIHSIGPAIIIPLARLLGLKVVMTHHGPDYERQKWGQIAKKCLLLGEWCAVKFSHEIIVISDPIREMLKKKYNRKDTHLIYNGVALPKLSTATGYIEGLGLKKSRYIIAVCRLVPEKGLHDLMSAYLTMQTDYKLVLVGDADHETEYSLSVKERAKQNNVLLTGFITGCELNEIFSNAALFVLPSYHEGLPIALLEAMAFNLKVVVSDIPANKEVELPKEVYFKTGDISALRKTILEQLNSQIQPNYRSIVQEKYDWAKIAKQVLNVYKKCLNVS